MSFDLLTFQHAFVTGGAGFIGSALVDRLLAMGCRVTAFDNLSSGFREFLEPASSNPGFTFIEGDVLDETALRRAMGGADFVFHLAANADVRFGLDHPRKDLEQNTIATSCVLEAMRSFGLRRIAFASTGSVYGESSQFPTPENAAFPVQTSLYGASKAAGEGLISAYCEGFGFQGYIFRFVSILGERYTHGHVFDFYQKLKLNPATLPVLGDGTQRKSYLYVQDCLDAMLTAIRHGQDKVNLFNLGTMEYVALNDSIAVIAAHLGLTPNLTYSGGGRGWAGDNPFIFLDTARIRALGWTPAMTISAAIVKTLDWLAANEWVFEKRR
jgi:UDP-glucose 4-epimerase